MLKGLEASTKFLHTDDEIVEETNLARPRVVAVDAPLALPNGRCCLEDGCDCRGRAHFRECDIGPRRMGIRFFPVTLGPMRSLTKSGMKLKEMLQVKGLEVIETYSGGAQDLLGLPRRTDVEGLRLGLKRIGIVGDVERPDISSHELDAITYAWVGRLFLSGQYMAMGSPEEALMFLPKSSSERRPMGWATNR